jgi:hypothetical protein
MEEVFYHCTNYVLLEAITVYIIKVLTFSDLLSLYPEEDVCFAHNYELKFKVKNIMTTWIDGVP